MGKIYNKGTWVDEILVDDPRFDILEDGGNPIYSGVQINLATEVAEAGTPVIKTSMDNLEEGIDILDTIIADNIFSITTGGSSTEYTLITIGEYDLTEGERFLIKFHTTAEATPTLNRDAKGAKLLKYYDGTGSKVSCGASTIKANMISEVEYDGIDYILLDILVPTISTYSEIDTGTEAVKYVAPAAFVASKRNVRHAEFRILDKDSNCTASTTIGGDWRLPTVSGTIIDVGAYHDTGGVTGTEVIDIHLNGTTIMTTNKINVATEQKSSENGGATQPVITTSAYTANGIFTFDIDTPHSGTPSKGCIVWLDIRES